MVSIPKKYVVWKWAKPSKRFKPVKNRSWEEYSLKTYNLVVSRALKVQRFLGHTNFQYTQLYIQLEESLFQDTQDDYMCKTATTAEEARALIEVGFEYVNEIQGIHLYRKRK